jgi:hypothetical protein
MENVLPVQPAKKNNKKKYIIGSVILGVLLLGLAVALVLVGRQQLFRQEASTPTGVATIRISPTTKSITVGQQFSPEIFFDTAGRAVTAIGVQLEYTFTGGTPPITTADNIQVNSVLLSENWNFTVKSVETIANKVVIQIGGTNSDQQGYTSTGEIKLATLSMTGQAPGSIVVTFNQSLSKITSEDNGQDVLLTPESSGTYEVTGGSTATPTSTATSTATGSAKPTATATATGTGTGTGTAQPTATATPTDDAGGTADTGTATPTPPPVPESGIGAPTILGIGLGLILIIIPLALAL